MVMDESTKLLAEPEFEEIRLLREAAKRGDNAELAKESQRLEDAFRDHLTKINTGPRAQTKIIMRNLLLERKLENYKALEAENIRLKKENQSRNRLRGRGCPSQAALLAKVLVYPELTYQHGSEAHLPPELPPSFSGRSNLEAEMQFHDMQYRSSSENSCFLMIRFCLTRSMTSLL
jgi:hypothetical protein